VVATLSQCARGVIRIALVLLIAGLLAPAQAAPPSATQSTIERVKASIVAVGTFQRARQPQFRFLGTGFAVSDGTLIATNAHVMPGSLEARAESEAESLVVVLPAREATQWVVRDAQPVAVAADQDLAVLRIAGPAVPPLALGDSDQVKDGQQYLFTGFPLGGVLGLIPSTHRAMIAAVTPIVLPTGNSAQLEASVIRQLKAGAFDVFQLDAMAFPGSSGSPLFDAASGDVIGIVNMALARSTREAALLQPTGIAYAIPANHLRELLRKIR
jgi:S1-C subfamily serine protease